MRRIRELRMMKRAPRSRKRRVVGSFGGEGDGGGDDGGGVNDHHGFGGAGDGGGGAGVLEGRRSRISSATTTVSTHIRAGPIRDVTNLRLIGE